MKIIIDSREKTPFSFKGETEKKSLKTGDYTVGGYEDRIAYERKSYGDLYSCLTSDLKRFKDQLERLSGFKHRGLVIESTVSEILLGHVHCDLPGEKALQRLVHWAHRYDIPVYFADEEGQKLTRLLLYEAWKEEEHDEWQG